MSLHHGLSEWSAFLSSLAARDFGKSVAWQTEVPRIRWVIFFLEETAIQSGVASGCI